MSYVRCAGAWKACGGSAMTRADEPYTSTAPARREEWNRHETDVPAHLLQLLHNTKLLRCLVIVYSSSYSLTKSNLRMLSKAVR